MVDNIIYNDMDEAIGYYSDIVKVYKRMIKEATDKNDYDEARELLNQLEEIDKFTDCDGLLVLSDNNGMGFTCKQYQPKESKGERA